MNPGNAMMSRYEAFEAERVRAHSIEVHGLLLLRALERHGFPVSDAARRFQRVCNSTGSVADEPAMTNGQ